MGFEKRSFSGHTQREWYINFLLGSRLGNSTQPVNVSHPIVDGDVRITLLRPSVVYMEGSKHLFQCGAILNGGGYIDRRVNASVEVQIDRGFLVFIDCQIYPQDNLSE